MPKKPVPEPVEDDEPEMSDRDRTVIRMYQEGATTAEITRETHVPRATIYWLLKRYDIPTDRITKPVGGIVSTSELLDRLREAERENGVLREKVIKLEALVDYLSVFTQAVRPAGDGVSRAPARPRTTGRK
jgi:hypothetical protein